MSEPFIVGQDYRINATLNVDITGATSIQIGYLKPGSSTPAYWTATLDDPLIGQIHYDVTPAQNDIAGTWRVWPKVLKADGNVLKTVAHSYQVVIEGTAYSDE